MDNNHVDDYVLVLEDRAEDKNEVEVGKLPWCQTSMKRENSRHPLTKKQPLFYVKQHIVLFQGIFSPKHRTISRERGTFSRKCTALRGREV